MFTKYRRFKNPKIRYTYVKILVLSIIQDNCGNKDNKMFKEEELIERLKILGLFDNMKEYYILHQINI